MPVSVCLSVRPSVRPSVRLSARLRPNGASYKKNKHRFEILSSRRTNLRELFLKIENFFLPNWYALEKNFRNLGKFFSWAILGRRKRFWKNFSSLGHSFAKMEHFKIAELKKSRWVHANAIKPRKKD